jgi:hypothetical protein
VRRDREEHEVSDSTEDLTVADLTANHFGRRVVIGMGGDWHNEGDLVDLIDGGERVVTALAVGPVVDDERTVTYWPWDRDVVCVVAERGTA